MSAMVDKGTSNALQKLSSQVGRSRHAQGDVPGRSGSSSQGTSSFRTPRQVPVSTDRSHLAHPSAATPTLAAPTLHAHPQFAPQHAQPQYRPPSHDGQQWANDFQSHQAISPAFGWPEQHSQQQQQPARPAVSHQQGFAPTWHPTPSYRPYLPQSMSQRPDHGPAVPSHLSAPTYAPPVPEITSSSLSETASLFVSAADNKALDDQTAEKLQASDFMSLMRDFAEGRKDVQGEEVVDARIRQGWDTSREGEEGWAQAFADGQTSVDIGKGKSRDWTGGLESLSINRPDVDTRAPRSVHFPPEASPYTTLSDAELQRATAVPSSSFSWEEDMNDDEAQEAFQFYNGPPRTQRRHRSQVQLEAELQKMIDGWDEVGGVGTEARVKRYEFQAANPWLDEKWVESRMATSMAGDDQSQGVLEQEARVLRDPGDARGWLDLGIKQQENEREQEAIAALEHCLSIDSSLAAAHLSLAVSYTNNSDPSSTFRSLESWARAKQASDESGTYGGLLEKWEISTGLGSVAREGFSNKERGEWLAGALLEMVQAGMQRGAGVDGDLQVALGVLFNTSGAFEQAQDCFRTALAVRPDDYQLYNRLGATLANGGKADEAYELYWRALELRPNFVRARFNLGISCINLKRYEEAAEHVLTALRLQLNESAAGRGKVSVGSATLWDTLRNACSFMCRPDLVELCHARELHAFDGIEFGEGGSWDPHG